MFLFNNKIKIKDIGNGEGTIDNIKINLEGNLLNLKKDRYIERNRYYIPLKEIASLSNGTFKRGINSVKFKIEKEKIIINISKNSWFKINIKTKEAHSGFLKKDLRVDNGEIYISLIDFSNILDLKSRWCSKEKLIKLHKDRDHEEVSEYIKKTSQKGILRLEDVSIGGSGKEYDSNYLECTRYIGAFLGARKVPYHVAWIPRYIDKKNNIDGDPSKEDKFTLAELVYTLDYLASRKGIIGLHGYTHQRDEEESGIGNEFGAEFPSVEELRDRIEKALKIAEYLDITVQFFEAPHYVITNEQNKELQKYFKYILNNYNCEEHLSNQFEIIKAKDHKESYYIPTPLYYVDDRIGDNMINVIKNMDEHIFAGLFYHPIVEHTLVDFKEGENGYSLMEYKIESTIKRVIEALEERGIDMIAVGDIND